jgi:phosphoribosylformylglycinamidine cyclo-ligase
VQPLSFYRKLGVDVKKKGIEGFREVVDDLYPEAFCVIQKDTYTPSRGMIFHTDSAGSKPVQAYLHYKETEDATWFTSLAQDALAMNVNDVYCVGAHPVSFIDYIAFNTLLIDRIDLLSSLAQGFKNSISLLRKVNIPIVFAGGETADLPDQIRTLDVCVALYAAVKLKNVITGNKITSGDIIIGLRSGGPLNYESKPNSGIMCNGLTLARNSLMKPEYLKKYPELAHTKGNRYFGKYSFDSEVDSLDMTVGEALLSPTRFYAPIIKNVLENHREAVHGIVHNTGGGQTKILRLGKNIKYIKNELPEPDPIFQLIQKESKVSSREMHQDFNMGIGLELIVDKDYSEEILSSLKNYMIGANLIGKCEKAKTFNELIIKTKHEEFYYR